MAQSEHFLGTEMTTLSTRRYNFMKKITQSSAKERQKWLVYDDVTNRKMTLHRISKDQLPVTAESFHGEFSRIPGSQDTVGMSMALFREVVLLRCSRKCQYILSCQGFALDAFSNLYISTEYFHGETLKLFLAKQPEKSLTIMKGVSRQLLKALNFLDCHKIVHNDVTSSNILVRHNDVSSSRGDKEFQLKLTNFEHARDSGTSVQRRDDYFCKDCHSVEHQCVASDDMTSFGYLLFASLQGCRPWGTSCSCDLHYVKFCKKLAHLKHEKTPEEYRAIPTNRLNHGKAKKNLSSRTSEGSSVSNVRPWGCKKTDAETSNLRNKRWQHMDKKFSNCLILLLSPFPSDKPTASELLSGSSYQGLFSEDNKIVPWTKKTFTFMFSFTCVSPRNFMTQ